MITTALIGGINYAWSDVQLILFGNPIRGIKSIKYDKKSDKKNTYGYGREPISRGLGKNEYSAEIVILKDEWQAIIQAAIAAGYNDPTDIPMFNIPVLFGSSQTTLKQDTLLSCEFTSDPMDTKEGDTDIWLTIPLIIGGIQHVIA